jgi:hypothetical protein
MLGAIWLLQPDMPAGRRAAPDRSPLGVLIKDERGTEGFDARRETALPRCGQVMKDSRNRPKKRGSKPLALPRLA